MFTNPFDPNLNIPDLKLNRNHTAQNAPDSAKFQSMLQKAKLSMMGELMNPLADSKQENLNINPFKGHQWVLDYMIQKSQAQNHASSQTPINKIAEIYKNENLNPLKEVESINSSNPPSVRELVTQTARKHGLPETFFQKLIGIESDFNPLAKSSKGAMGLGQIMPETARELGLDIMKSEGQGSIWDPESNLDASARYLRQLYNRYDHSGIDAQDRWKFAAGAYNAGMGNIQKAIQKVSQDQPLKWDQVASVLPQVTGSSSRETIRYVDRLPV